MIMKIFITYICVLSLSLFSCGDSRRLGSERKGGIGENCTKTDDCENPLKCLNKVCSKSGSIGGTDGPVGPGNNSTGTGTGAEPGNGTGVESGNGTGTGTGTGNGTETAKKCPSDQHKEDDQCISNTRQCNNKIQNGTGLETWANGWGLCKVNGCDSGFAITA